MPKKKSRTRDSEARMRKIKQPQYKSFKVSKRIRQPKPEITGSFRLLYRSIKFIYDNWKLFGGITLVYFILTLVLVTGFGISGDISQLKDDVLSLFEGSNAELLTGVTLFSVLVGSATTAVSETAATYQTILFLIISLVMIWALRQRLAAKPQVISVRDAFYKGLYPLVPFVLVFVVFCLQLLPLAAANFLYSKVIVAGLAVTAIEIGLWVVLMFLLAILSLYMVTSSVFALYVVTLPDVKPIQALRSARELVKFRRWTIMRKLLFLPLALLFGTAAIVIPMILISPDLAEWLFLALSMFVPVIMHTYIYGIYRELL